MKFIFKLVIFSNIILFCFGMSVFGYKSQDAVNYANKYTDNLGKYGKIYNKYDVNKNPKGYNVYANDCANFVSQCLIAGGQDLSKAGKGIVDSNGCITYCSDLNNYLANYLNAETSLITGKGIPSTNLSAGDVVIFGNDTNDYAHAAFVVGVEGGTVLLNAHTSHRSRVSFNSMYKGFTKATYYHFNDNNASVDNKTEQLYYSGEIQWVSVDKAYNDLDIWSLTKTLKIDGIENKGRINASLSIQQPVLVKRLNPRYDYKRKVTNPDVPCEVVVYYDVTSGQGDVVLAPTAVAEPRLVQYGVYHDVGGDIPENGFDLGSCYNFSVSGKAAMKGNVIIIDYDKQIADSLSEDFFKGQVTITKIDK